MFHLLAFLFFFVLIILFAGLSIVGSILRALFGIGRRRTATGNYQRNGQYQSMNQNTDGYNTSSSKDDQSANSNNQQGKHKKIFSQEEGEYVDFEEIK